MGWPTWAAIETARSSIATPSQAGATTLSMRTTRRLKTPRMGKHVRTSLPFFFALEPNLLMAYVLASARRITFRAGARTELIHCVCVGG
eukprot:COSAG01_NODE_1399_length_10465_cov_3.558267_20_plen_89_part_00